MAFKIQTKTPDGGWFTVEADSYDNFFADLATVFGQDRADRMIVGIQSGGGAPAPAAAAPSAPPAPPAPPSAPPAPPAAPAAPQVPAGGPPAGFDNPPWCEHGQRRAVSYTSKSGRDAGKQKYMFFCPLGQERRSEQCPGIDAVTGEQWGKK